jgi:hypothetical protein
MHGFFLFLVSKKLLEGEGDVDFVQFTEHIDRQNSESDYLFYEFEQLEFHMFIFSNHLHVTCHLKQAISTLSLTHYPPVNVASTSAYFLHIGIGLQKLRS